MIRNREYLSQWSCECVKFDLMLDESVYVLKNLIGCGRRI